jgi:hypothetical protein
LLPVVITLLPWQSPWDLGQTLRNGHVPPIFLAFFVFHYVSLDGQLVADCFVFPGKSIPTPNTVRNFSGTLRIIWIGV